MRNFQKIAEIDVVPLLAAIKRQPELWKEDTYLRDYPQGPFKDIESIMLRFPEKSVHETEEALQNHLASVDQHESINYPAYTKLPQARPIIMALMARVEGERLGRCMINKIKPGGRIFPHADTASHAAYYDRFHISLQSAPGCNFRAGDEEIHMWPGDVWWFDNSVEHEVVNNGDVDRIHLIVDIRCAR